MTSKIVFNNGFFMAPNELFDLDLTSHEKIVYLYICRCANNSTAFPSYNTIAKKCSMSRSKAISVVDTLLKMELIKKYIRKNEYKKNHSNLYEIVPIGEHHSITSVQDTSLSVQYAPPSVQDTPNKELPYKNILNNKKYKGAEFDSPLHFSFNDYLVKYNPNMKVTACVRHYLWLYEKNRGNAHPRLKKINGII